MKWKLPTITEGASLVLSIIAIALSVQAYYGPRTNAAERIEIERRKMVVFAAGRPADCKDRGLCDTWIELIESAGKDAQAALEAERSNLSSDDYFAAYAEIYGPMSEALDLKLQLENPGLQLPDFPTDDETVRKARELRKRVKEARERAGVPPKN